MAKENFSVARVETRTRASVGKFERHIERKNESYENMNVDLSRTPMNVSFKGCGELTYNEYLDQMIAAETVSLKGLKPDAKVFDEMIMDVNTEYFEKNGGYDFACRFYEEAFRFAEKIYGKDNNISAVMHADELNVAMTEKYGRPIYHYHLHIMALPVVDKEVRWSKRCKSPELVGTVKEVIHQVSHSKKWRSEKALDVEQKAHSLYVFAVPPRLFGNRQLVAPVDLRPAGQPRQHVVCGILISFGNLIILIPQCGARADERHFALQNVEKLRQLVHTGCPEESSYRKNARILLPCFYRSALLFRIHDHGAEFVNTEHLSIQCQTLLGIKYRALIRIPD